MKPFNNFTVTSHSKVLNEVSDSRKCVSLSSFIDGGDEYIAILIFLRRTSQGIILGVGCLHNAT